MPRITPRVPMIAPDGSRTLVTEAGADVLIEQGYELADAEPEVEVEPTKSGKSKGE